MDVSDLAINITNQMFTVYWNRMWQELEKVPGLKKTVPAFLVCPEKIIYYIGLTHFAIEYFGSDEKEIIERPLRLDIEVFAYTSDNNLLDHIIGLEYAATSKLKLPISGINEDIYAPTNAAIDALEDYGWSFAAQNMILPMNITGFDLNPNEFTRIINSFFYDVDKKGLAVRHIKWLDCFPIVIHNEDEEHFQFSIMPWEDSEKVAINDVNHKLRLVPDFQLDKLRALYRFIELFCSKGVTEVNITQFLSRPENHFILKMAFFSKKILPELQCKWADEEKKDIRPDFFIEQPNGYCDIVEFKLPNIDGQIVVGGENRETFNAKISSYISQTRTYSEYFEDPRNRHWVFEDHGIKVLYPTRFLVIGRRWMFSNDDWKRIENDYKNIVIRTFDDLVDGVKSQLYS